MTIHISSLLVLLLSLLLLEGSKGMARDRLKVREAVRVRLRAVVEPAMAAVVAVSRA